RATTASPATHLDIQATGGSTGAFGQGGAFSGLLKYKHGADIKPPAYLVTGDLAESWQQADDLTYVFKLRPGVKWHNIAPVNGRDLVLEDIVYSWDRVKAFKSYANLLEGISKYEAVDKTTFKITLDKPNADILNNLGQNTLIIVAN